MINLFLWLFLHKLSEAQLILLSGVRQQVSNNHLLPKMFWLLKTPMKELKEPKTWPLEEPTPK